MKITLDIPNTTLCAFINYVFVEKNTHGMSLGVRSLGSKDLSDGNEIKVDPYKGGEDE